MGTIDRLDTLYERIGTLERAVSGLLSLQFGPFRRCGAPDCFVQFRTKRSTHRFCTKECRAFAAKLRATAPSKEYVPSIDLSTVTWSEEIPDKPFGDQGDFATDYGPSVPIGTVPEDP